MGHVINLSKKTFTKATFQLLNKNLNFIPTRKYTINIKKINLTTKKEVMDTK